MDSDRIPLPLMDREVSELWTTFWRNPLRALLIGALVVAFIILPSLIAALLFN